MKRVGRSSDSQDASAGGQALDGTGRGAGGSLQPQARRRRIRECVATACVVALVGCMVVAAAVLAVGLASLTARNAPTEELFVEEEHSMELDLRRRYCPASPHDVNQTLVRQRRNLCANSPGREALSCVPRAFILGAEQATAQGLSRAIKEATALQGPTVKEIAFYSRTDRWLQGWELLTWMYRYTGQQLVSEDEERLIDPAGEYLSAPFAAERIYLSIRESARFVVVLRDPVDRALDQFFYERERDETAVDPFGYFLHQRRTEATLGEILVEELVVLKHCAAGSVPDRITKRAAAEMDMGPMAMGDHEAMEDRQAMADDDDMEDIVQPEGYQVAYSDVGETEAPHSVLARGVGRASARARAEMRPPEGFSLPDKLYSVLGDCLVDCGECHPTGTPHIVYRDGGILAKGLYLELLEPYFNLFGKENFLFVHFEELHSHPSKASAVLNEVAAFLGVPGMTEEEWGGALNITDAATRLRSEFPEVDPALRRWLSDFYRLPNQELQRALQRDFHWS